MRLSPLFQQFFKSEKAGGLLLIFCTCFSLLITNSFLGEHYLGFWNISLGGMTLVQWINDALMTIFFLLVGLELERELFIGELSVLKNAMLPIAAALGGMIVPALIFYFITQGSVYERGFGIPMATDIAFSLTILSLFSSRVPLGLRVFLSALAIADDLGAILVIALFYSDHLSLIYLGLSLSLFAFLFILGRLKIYTLWPYLIGGTLMWYCTHHSGIHATISGVMLAFAIPFGKEDSGPSFRLQSFLHLPVAFFILPLFALANTCISLSGIELSDLQSIGVYGTVLGLVVGKPVGIFLFTYLSKQFGGLSLPTNVTMKHILGAGIVAGIGFTMSIFITELAFTDAMSIKQIKIAILTSAFLSSIGAMLWFVFTIPKVNASVTKE